MNLVRRALRCGARQSRSPPPPPTRSRSWSRSRSPPPPPTSPAWSSWSPPSQLDHGHLLQLLLALPACVWKRKGWSALYFYFSESFLVLTLPRISQSRQSCLLFQQGLLTQLASVQRHCTQKSALYKECMLYIVFQQRLLTRLAAVNCNGAVHKVL